MLSLSASTHFFQNNQNTIKSHHKDGHTWWATSALIT
jgi:hypothetical protein